MKKKPTKKLDPELLRRIEEEDDESSGGGSRHLTRKDKIQKTHQRQFTEEDDDQGGSGTSDLKGKIDFGIPRRDDLLPARELDRLLTIHSAEHEIRVVKQKEMLQARNDLKSQPVQNRQQTGQRMSPESGFPPHPILFNKSQFSGAQDNKVTSLPSESISQTNDGEKNEKTNEFRKKYTPDFVPAPANTLVNTPKLTRTG